MTVAIFNLLNTLSCITNVYSSQSLVTVVHENLNKHDYINKLWIIFNYNNQFFNII